MAAARAVAPAPSTVVRSDAADGAPPKADEWVVERGDHLWRVAEETLGERGEATTDAAVARYWRELIALNRGAIGPDWRSHFLAVGDASNAPIKKPHPQVYLKVLADMPLPSSDCVAFEDSANGLQAAMAAGLPTVITPNDFTAHHDFQGALRVVPGLSAVKLAHLREWHAAVQH